ncbi:hypothetical protein LSAT2_004864 [Lamellibrachia satsuma]|nr:hypothetical protein LSAT2_004864 [Lamellibrachia satsuma]
MCPQGFSGRTCSVSGHVSSNQKQKLLSIIILIILGTLGLVLWFYAGVYCFSVGNPRRDDDHDDDEQSRRRRRAASDSSMWSDSNVSPSPSKLKHKMMKLSTSGEHTPSTSPKSASPGVSLSPKHIHQSLPTRHNPHHDTIPTQRITTATTPQQWRYSAYHHCHYSKTLAPLSVSPLPPLPNSGATQRITTATSPQQWRHSAYHHYHHSPTLAPLSVSPLPLLPTVAPLGVSPLPPLPNSGATQRITTATTPQQWRHSGYHHCHHSPTVAPLSVSPLPPFPNSAATQRITTATTPQQWRHSAYHHCHHSPTVAPLSVSPLPLVPNSGATQRITTATT